MISQQLTYSEVDMSGTLVIQAAPGYLAELLSLATELEARPNVTTNGTIYQLPPEPPPVD